MTIIENITYKFIDKVINELNKIENKNRINIEIISPLLNLLSASIIDEFYPFILLATSIFILTFIFAFIIMMLLLKK